MAANVNNYIAAGNAAVRSAVGIRNSLAASAPDYGSMGQEAVAQEAKSRANKKANKAREKYDKERANTKVEINDINIKSDEKVRNTLREGRKAGMLAGGVALLGASQLMNRRKQEPNAQLALIKEQQKYYANLNREAIGEAQRISDELESRSSGNSLTSPSKSSPAPDGFSVPGGEATSNGELTNTGATQYQGLTGARKVLADAIAGPESGSWGYDAFNQGGANNGRSVVGRSGSHQEAFGKPLTDMTLSEIFYRQNTEQRGLSMDEHISSGGLHAVGRYQFIGSTLQDEVAKMGLDPKTTKFTPEVQDQIFLSHAKRVGNISPWVGPMDQYSPQKRDELNSIIQGL